MQHYDRHVELPEIIKELQWPEVSNGTSLQQMCDHLNAEGVHAKVVGYAPGTEFTWDSPIVLHLGKLDSGHFIVWLPPESGTHARVWDPISVKTKGPPNLDQLSGLAIVTSASPITMPVDIGRDPMSFQYLSFVLSCVAGLIFGVATAKFVNQSKGKNDV